MKILITSFGPFNDFKFNPSNQVMERLNQKINLPGTPLADYEFETIDVSWNGVTKFIEAKKNDSFDFIIHLGVATNETKMRIETCGQNIQSGTDIENVSPKENHIIENESNLITNISIEALNNFVLKNEIIVMSSDAGTYLCNYLYYKSLYFLGKNSSILFIHTADTQNQLEAPTVENQSEIIFRLLNILTKNLTRIDL